MPVILIVCTLYVCNIELSICLSYLIVCMCVILNCLYDCFNEMSVCLLCCILYMFVLSDSLHVG